MDGPPSLAASTAIVVPSREAAAALGRTLAGLSTGNGPASPGPLTREELYDFLHAGLSPRPRRLGACDREVIVRASAAAATAAGSQPPFTLRPGLVAEMLRFYDQLKRQSQSVDRFEELLLDELAGDRDRGADRMARQTRFLAASFREYERRVAAAGAIDEHGLRDRLIQDTAAHPIRRVVIAVSDWIAEPGGLFPADYDLLARMDGLERIEIVATEALLRSGFHQRVHRWLPDLEEVEGRALGVGPSPVPELLVPEGAGGRMFFISRDREEELIAVARLIAHGRLDAARTAVVFERPLPYLYLAAKVFGAARISYETSMGLPLAAEPFAATLDLMLDAAASRFGRQAILALLRCPHLLADPPAPGALAALDRALQEARYAGDLALLRSVESTLDDQEVASALQMAAGIGAALEPLLSPRPASRQLDALRALLTSPSTAGDRDEAARAAVSVVLDSLAAAHAAHDDRVVTIDDLAADIRRWIEGQTLPAPSAGGGVHLVDPRAARFGEFDHVVLVGVIEHEWPERPPPNVFYSTGLLAALGWPSEQDRRSAASAAFQDLVRSPLRDVMVSTISLDDEALVEPAVLLTDLAAAGLAVAELAIPDVRVSADEALSLDPIDCDRLDDDARPWLTLREGRTARADAVYHGAAGAWSPGPLSVSALETYLTCPFKFFARHVLRLGEEVDETDVMDPRKRGQFVHDVFHTFFAAWQAGGRRAITAGNLDEARRTFAETADTLLARLPEAEAGLERTRLLGSSVALGLGEIVFRMEAERPIEVVERLLEYSLDGEYELDGPEGPRLVRLRGVADRLDLLEDGTIRLIDYKLGSSPPRSRALQLPIYGFCAEHRLRGRLGREWKLGEAAYIAFRGPKAVVPLFSRRTDRDDELAAAQTRLVGALAGIESGRFPPTPDDVFLCGFCGYGAVCRKDYVGDA
jgi:ATP-dependent helicase/nuclease subunit B